MKNSLEKIQFRSGIVLALMAGLLVMLFEQARCLFINGVTLPLPIILSIGIFFFVFGLIGVLILNLSGGRLFSPVVLVLLIIYLVLTGTINLIRDWPFDIDSSPWSLLVPYFGATVVWVFIRELRKGGRPVITLGMLVLLVFGWSFSTPEYVTFSRQPLLAFTLNSLFLTIVLAMSFLMKQKLDTRHRYDLKIIAALMVTICGMLLIFSTQNDYCRFEDSVGSSIPAESTVVNKPNVIIIVADALRADHVSLYGYDKKTTPFLESLADEALVYENMISVSPWTLPSHASLFTGKYPRTHGARRHNFKYGNVNVSRWAPLQDYHETLAEILKARHGYRTIGVCSNNIMVKDRKSVV